MYSNNLVNKYLIYFLFLHIFIWTVVPSVFNANLHLDTIEALAWGNELEWGYDKWPPMFPIFTELFFKIFGNQDWAYYFLSQIFVIITFFLIFKFSLFFFEEKIYALISIMLLEGIYFFNYTTPELNAFICEFPFLAATVFFCWKAINQNDYYNWIMFAAFAGFSSLTYYLSVYLLASIGLFFLSDMIYKKKINLKYFLVLFIYLIIISPHLYWLYNNEFKSVGYAIFRSFDDPLSGINEIKLFDHLLYPLIFLIKQIIILIPFLVILKFLIISFKVKINFKDKKLIFLFTIFILPIILMFLTSLLGGIRIRTMWMTTFYLFPGIFFVYLYKENIRLNNLKSFFNIFLLFFILSPILYAADSYFKKEKRTDFPGEKIAKSIQEKWNRNFSEPIEIVVGEGWVYGGWYGGNLSYHLENRPKLKYSLSENFNTGVIFVEPLKSKKKCKGLKFKIDPYFEACMVGKK
tara:strand:+ start:467 stop:1858 length:1392 start_codon:yes stop_codon:yes gene_type:complete